MKKKIDKPIEQQLNMMYLKNGQKKMDFNCFNSFDAFQLRRMKWSETNASEIMKQKERDGKKRLIEEVWERWIEKWERKRRKVAKK